MSDEVLAEAPAPEQVATAAPEPEIAAPVEAQPESPKSFSQEELDAAIGKRLAREQRKWEREARQAEAPKPVPVEHVTPEQYTTTEEYVEALTTSKAQQIVQQQQYAKQQQELLGSYHEKEEDARGRYEDFEQVTAGLENGDNGQCKKDMVCKDNGSNFEGGIRSRKRELFVHEDINKKQEQTKEQGKKCQFHPAEPGKARIGDIYQYSYEDGNN